MILWHILIPLWSANVAMNIYWELRQRYPRIPNWSLDGGKMAYDGKRIFGESKTVLGLPIAIVFGWGAGVIFSLPLGFQLGICTYVGSVVSGFIKRRLGIETHGKLPVIDQCDYLLAAFVYLYFLGYRWNVVTILITLIVTLCVHWATNKIAYKLQLRSRGW